MASVANRHEPKLARVDRLIDENGYPIDVPDNSALKAANDHEPTVGATGPTNWWLTGLVALLIVAAILLALQLMGGNPGTDVVPGTPVAAPQSAQ